jgi:hypothetical protein
MSCSRSPIVAIPNPNKMEIAIDKTIGKSKQDGYFEYLSLQNNT